MAVKTYRLFLASILSQCFSRMILIVCDRYCFLQKKMWSEKKMFHLNRFQTLIVIRLLRSITWTSAVSAFNTPLRFVMTGVWVTATYWRVDDEPTAADVPSDTELLSLATVLSVGRLLLMRMLPLPVLSALLLASVSASASSIVLTFSSLVLLVLPAVELMLVEWPIIVYSVTNSSSSTWPIADVVICRTITKIVIMSNFLRKMKLEKKSNNFIRVEAI